MTGPTLLAPSSFAQRRIWFLAALDDDLAAYNVSRSFRLRGRLDLPAFRRAVTELVRRQESLRTTFPAGNDGLLQAVWPPPEVDLAEIDLAGCPDPGGEAAARSRRAAREPFHLDRGPLFRPRLWRLGEDEHLLTLTLHHLVCDAWSDAVIHRQLTALYGSAATGRPPAVPEPGIGCADFAAWQLERLRGDHLAGLLDYWRDRLRGASPALGLRGPGGGSSPLARRLPLSAEAVEAARRCAAQRRLTQFAVLLTAFHLALAGLTGRRDLLVGTLAANRYRPEVEDLVGCFANPLPLRADLAGNPRLDELLGQIGEATFEDQVHQELPFDRLVQEIPLGWARGAPFEATFQVLDLRLPAAESAGLCLEPLPAEAEPARGPLNLVVVRDGDGWSAVWEHDGEAIGERAVAELHDLWIRCLTALSESPHIRVEELLPAPAAPPLPGPAPAAAEDDDEEVSPLEDLLMELWSEVLEVDGVRAEDDFFDLGGHSLLATQVVSRLRRQLDITVPVRVLFEHPVLRDQARAILRVAVDADPELLSELSPDGDR